MTRAPWFLVAATLALALALAFSLAGKINNHPTFVRPVVGPEPTTTSEAPHEPQDALRTTTTTIPPRVRQKAFQSAYASEVATLIREGFARFGPAVAEQAVRVAWCESRHVPGARNGVHAGTFQLSETYHLERARRLGFTWAQMFEARPNIAVAADLYADSGWQPWQCSP